MRDRLNWRCYPTEPSAVFNDVPDVSAIVQYPLCSIVLRMGFALEIVIDDNTGFVDIQ